MIVVFFGAFYLINLMLAVVAMSYDDEAGVNSQVLNIFGQCDQYCGRSIKYKNTRLLSDTNNDKTGKRQKTDRLPGRVDVQLRSGQIAARLAGKRTPAEPNEADEGEEGGHVGQSQSRSGKRLRPAETASARSRFGLGAGQKRSGQTGIGQTTGPGGSGSDWWQVDTDGRRPVRRSHTGSQSRCPSSAGQDAYRSGGQGRGRGSGRVGFQSAHQPTEESNAGLRQQGRRQRRPLPVGQLCQLIQHGRRLLFRDVQGAQLPQLCRLQASHLHQQEHLAKLFQFDGEHREPAGRHGGRRDDCPAKQPVSVDGPRRLADGGRQNAAQSTQSPAAAVQRRSSSSVVQTGLRSR